jgi:hypothetical protein
MAIGESICPRRQAASQGWAQIIPHTEARGLGPRANLYAWRYSPRAIKVA